MAAVSIGLLAVPAGFATAKASGIDYPALRRTNHGLGAACEFDDRFTPKPECRTSESPRMLVWGDSFAMHLVPGILATGAPGIVQATKSECAPFTGLSRFTLEFPGRSWAERCIEYNASVMDYLASAKSIEVVVLSSPFSAYLAPRPDGPPPRNLRLVGGTSTEVDASLTLALQAMGQTISGIRSLNKRVIVVAPPPSDGAFDSSKCVERMHQGKLVLGTKQENCDISVEQYRRSWATVHEFLERLSRESSVTVIRFDSTLCTAKACQTRIGATPIYRDKGHFSYDGSREVGRRMSLGTRLMAEAK